MTRRRCSIGDEASQLRVDDLSGDATFTVSTSAGRKEWEKFVGHVFSKHVYIVVDGKNYRKEPCILTLGLTLAKIGGAPRMIVSSPDRVELENSQKLETCTNNTPWWASSNPFEKCMLEAYNEDDLSHIQKNILSPFHAP